MTSCKMTSSKMTSSKMTVSKMTASDNARVGRTLFVAVTGLVLLSGAAAAGREDTLEANREILRQRIEQGRYSGQLTRAEYRRLQAEEAKIDADIKRALDDGRLSRREYEKLHDEQIAAYRHVHADASNTHVSWWRQWLYRTR